MRPWRSLNRSRREKDAVTGFTEIFSFEKEGNFVQEQSQSKTYRASLSIGRLTASSLSPNPEHNGEP